MPKKAAPTWKEYQEKAINDRIPRSQPLLYPIMIGMDMVKIGKSPVKSPVITRSRLKTTTLGVEGKTSRNYLMPKVARAVTERQADLFGPVYKHYYDFYHPYDGQQSPVKPSPLDMYGLKHPVVFMFWLKHKNWAFSGQKQFDVENDVRGNPTVQQMTTFGNRRGLLVYNGCGVDYRLKYNLYVTISQYEDPTVPSGYQTTDIIIDPGMNNNSGSGGGEGLP